MSSEKTRFEVLRDLVQRGARSALFTTGQIREELGYSPSSSEAHLLHAIVADLKKSRVVTIAGEGRSRHQYLQVEPAKRDDLERRFSKASMKLGRSRDNGTGRAPLSEGAVKVPRRFQLLEHRVDAIENSLKADTERYDKLAAELASLREEVHQLVELWS